MQDPSSPSSSPSSPADPKRPTPKRFAGPKAKASPQAKGIIEDVGSGSGSGPDEAQRGVDGGGC